MDQPPNILYIHSHDTGRYVQPYGFQVPTPNIQLLADQGVLFREAFCAAPTCSGSRASLLTGLLLPQQRHARARPPRLGAERLRPALGPRPAPGRLPLDPDRRAAHLRRPRRDRLRRGGRGRLQPRRGRGAADDRGAARRRPPSPGSCRSASSRPTATSSPRPRSATRSTRCRRPTSPTSPRPAATWPPSRPAPARSTRGSARSSTPCTTSAWSTNTLVICTTDHGVAFPGAKATLFDRGIGVMMIMRGPGGFTGGKVIDAPVSHLDVYPTLCELAGVEAPDWLQGASLMPLVRGETERLHEAIFAEMTYHAAYEPQRAGPHRALEVHPPLRRLRAPGAGQLRRQRQQGPAGRGGLGRADRARGAALRPGPRPGRGRQPGRRPGAGRGAGGDAGPARRLDARDRGPAARRPGGAAAGGDRQRAVAGLARRPAARHRADPTAAPSS